MKKEKTCLEYIPAIIWGEKSDKVYIFVHGKMSNKESAEAFAEIAASRGYQTISFDLPEHGERTDRNYKCNVMNGVTDLAKIGNYVFEKWQTVSLFGCSLGACFSLYTYQNRRFENCLFQSPIVNMEYLIQQMFIWFGITEEQLKVAGEIETPVDTMSWLYYQYIKENPIYQWTAPTHVLYGAKDNLQSREVIDEFAGQFGCKVTVAENSEHAFMNHGDEAIVKSWIEKSLL
ncbi:alpha/beta hydrolase [Scatolibacter rhodanostii]|uniref:alpha/beta hydrolase n=1 Tax=Scatolibacter rhodanostii TaxID=2014781 RepID=UPI000C06DF79|nr:alpha/beta hydrolase [Scatolibacter rhodanostii]